MPDTIIAVGAGATAAAAARTLRRRGFDGRLVLLGEEPHAPYQRPPLSKEYLTEGMQRQETCILSEQWCRDNGVELRLGTAVRRVDTAGGVVELADGARVPGDAVLLVPGARPRRLPGVEGERVVHLRNVEDAEKLRAYVRPGERIVVVGAGFVGSEVASSAVAAGAEVVVLEQGGVPLERVLGAEAGAVCGRIQRDNGVGLHTGQAVVSVTETADGVVVTTADGLHIEGSAVVVAVGAVPNTGVAEASGIAVDDGILADEYCRTSAPSVFAAGDVARHRHPLFGEQIRVEHFDNAGRQGAAAAGNMLGDRTAYGDPHWFWSDQFGLSLQHCGHAGQWDRLVVRGSVEELDFTAFYLSRGTLKAAFAVERGGDIAVAKELIARGAAPDPQLLRDEDTDLADLAGPARSARRTKAAPAGTAGPGRAGGRSAEADPAVKYFRVARSGQVPEGVVRRFSVNGVELAVSRSGGTVHISSNRCTHLACLLSSGKVTEDGLRCSCHGSVFDFVTGEPLAPPAMTPVQVFPAEEEEGEILVGMRPKDAGDGD